MPSPPRGAIEFRHVTFAYPSAPDARAIDDLSFADRAGRAGRYRRRLGRRQVDRVPAHHALLRLRRGPGARRWGRREGGRSEASFARASRRCRRRPRSSARASPRTSPMGGPTASEPAIEEAARRAAADGFIRELDKGYATRLGERGVTLSGGQRQRLAIARAILKDCAGAAARRGDLGARRRAMRRRSRARSTT